VSTIGLGQLRVHLSRHVVFYKFDRRSMDWIPGGPPDDFMQSYLTWGTGWTLPTLHGISEVPMLRADGRVSKVEGYDAESGIFVDYGGAQYPDIPERPTREQALAALAEIKHLLRAFPFISDTDGSVAVAMYLTALVRRILSAAPIFLINAPTPGTGKGLLVSGAAIIATGRVAPATTWTVDEAENEKRLISSLISGDAVLLLDNVTAPLCGDFICSLATETECSPRLLGGNIKPRLPTNVLVAATGNNIKVKGDMTRRAIRCTLDSGEEHPEKRKIGWDFKAAALADRPALVTAVLTVLSAWLSVPAAERGALVDKLEPFGSFDEWTALIRGALVWLGEADPVAKRGDLLDDDTETASMQQMIAAWNASLNLRELYEADAGQEDNDLLRQAINAAAPTKLGAATVLSLQRWLSAHLDRPMTVDGHQYRFTKDLHPQTRRAMYRLERIEPTLGFEAAE
jgi:hypothetical protein